jgi:hypothetical protein
MKIFEKSDKTLAFEGKESQRCKFVLENRPLAQAREFEPTGK